MKLLDHLKERFPTEHVEPYGDCLIVPLTSFSKAMDEQLTKHGYAVYYTAVRGRTCGIIPFVPKQQRKPETEDPSTTSQIPPTTPSTEKEHTPPQFWTPEEVEKLRIYYAQRKSTVEIARMLGHSTKSTLGRLGHEIKTGHLAKHQDEQTPAASTQTPVPPTESSTEHPTISPETSKNESQNQMKQQQPSVEELLFAVTLLHASGHRKVCSYLLGYAQEKISGEEK